MVWILFWKQERTCKSCPFGLGVVWCLETGTSKAISLWTWGTGVWKQENQNIIPLPGFRLLLLSCGYCFLFFKKPNHPPMPKGKQEYHFPLGLGCSLICFWKTIKQETITQEHRKTQTIPTPSSKGNDFLFSCFKNTDNPPSPKGNAFPVSCCSKQKTYQPQKPQGTILICLGKQETRKQQTINLDTNTWTTRKHETMKHEARNQQETKGHPIPAPNPKFEVTWFPVSCFQKKRSRPYPNTNRKTRKHFPFGLWDGLDLWKPRNKNNHSPLALGDGLVFLKQEHRTSFPFGRGGWSGALQFANACVWFPCGHMFLLHVFLFPVLLLPGFLFSRFPNNETNAQMECGVCVLVFPTKSKPSPTPKGETISWLSLWTWFPFWNWGMVWVSGFLLVRYPVCPVILFWFVLVAHVFQCCQFIVCFLFHVLMCVSCMPCAMFPVVPIVHGACFPGFQFWANRKSGNKQENTKTRTTTNRNNKKTRNPKPSQNEMSLHVLFVFPKPQTMHQVQRETGTSLTFRLGDNLF